MRLTLALLCLISCAAVQRPSDPIAECVTRCGLHSLIPISECRTLQRYEDKAVATFAKDVVDLDAGLVCKALDGWMVYPHARKLTDYRCQAPAWDMVDPLDQLFVAPMCVVGYTHEGSKSIELTAVSWFRGEETNSLAHEMVHVVDMYVKKYNGHCEWRRRGVKKALREITGYEDWTDPGPGCKVP